MNRYWIFATMFAGACVVAAQDNPLSAELKRAHTTIKNYVVKSAEKMPEENYSFKPTPEVRSFGQILGHVADAEYFFCSTAKGESKQTDIEKTKTSKADLVAAIKESFAYCDGVFDSATDADMTKMVKMGQRERSKIAILWGTGLGPDGNPDANAPKPTDIAIPLELYVGGKLANTPDNLARWVQDPQGVSPGTDMPNLGVSVEEARNIATAA